MFYLHDKMAACFYRAISQKRAICREDGFGIFAGPHGMTSLGKQKWNYFQDASIVQAPRRSFRVVAEGKIGGIRGASSKPERSFVAVITLGDTAIGQKKRFTECHDGLLAFGGAV